VDLVELTAEPAGHACFHLADQPVRQWVLTLPYPLRYRCLYDSRLTSQVLRAFLRALFAELRRRARHRRGISRDQCGAVTFIQRFGSALNENLHFHTLVLDGVYSTDDGAPPYFLPRPPPTADEAARVPAGTARRIARLLASRADGEDDVLARDEPLLATLAAASLRARSAPASPPAPTRASGGGAWAIASSPKTPTPIPKPRPAFPNTAA
jgi:hypothetical protein